MLLDVFFIFRILFNATRDRGQKTGLWSMRGGCPGPVVPYDLDNHEIPWNWWNYYYLLWSIHRLLCPFFIF